MKKIIIPSLIAFIISYSVFAETPQSVQNSNPGSAKEMTTKSHKTSGKHHRSSAKKAKKAKAPSQRVYPELTNSQKARKEYQ
ncbi:MAG: hypothetical protein ACR65R_08190 [Methylomicrobium sp.]|jgi:hypothetical protein